ncbi:MAG: chorismate-binding protein, partial [Thiotrichaceae bacterium]|nr:chorismate-binding protein [Thiotrichaceae bacterium]
TKNKIELQSLVEADTKPYLQQVEKIKQYLLEGDIFQPNLSRQWQAVLKHNVADLVLFDALSKHNPSSFAAMACLQNMTIISSSPERLVSLRNGLVETRPVAGTRPRDENRQSDAALAKELLSHPKEQAEHIMLIDLVRNDLGKVCIPGTVSVDELMVNETYAHVHHIVSNVIGQLEEGVAPGDIIKALFPGGTITGCPKVRCMEIIAGLEQQARGAYTGSMGYINRDGSMDLNILIRSMVLQKQTFEPYKLSFRAGAGLVYDSIAEKELQETRDKAMGLIRALQ